MPEVVTEPLTAKRTTTPWSGLPSTSVTVAVTVWLVPTSFVAIAGARTIVAGGQAQLKGKIFRIGHMGICSFEDLRAGFAAIEQTLAELGRSVETGAAVEAIASRA